MKISFSTLIYSILLLGLLAACAVVSSDTISIDEQDAGKTIELKTGDTLEISLNGNLTTGFNWIPAVLDPALLEQVGEIEVTPASDQPGAPGIIIIKFKAIATGQTNLHLDYKRPWEDTAVPEQTFDVTVIVE